MWNNLSKLIWGGLAVLLLLTVVLCVCGACSSTAQDFGANLTRWHILSVAGVFFVAMNILLVMVCISGSTPGQPDQPDKPEPPKVRQHLQKTKICTCGFSGHYVEADVDLLRVAEVRHRCAELMDAGPPVSLVFTDGQVVQVEGEAGHWVEAITLARRLARKAKERDR